VPAAKKNMPLGVTRPLTPSERTLREGGQGLDRPVGQHTTYTGLEILGHMALDPLQAEYRPLKSLFVLWPPPAARWPPPGSRLRPGGIQEEGRIAQVRPAGRGWRMNNNRVRPQRLRNGQQHGQPESARNPAYPRVVKRSPDKAKGQKGPLPGLQGGNPPPPAASMRLRPA